MGRKKKTTRQKGEELQVEFGEFLKKELGYNKYRSGCLVHGNLNPKGTEADVVAEKLDARGISFYKMAKIFYLITFILIGLSIYLFIINLLDGALIFLFCGAAYFFFTMLFINWSRKHNSEHCWAECKNQQSKINIEQIGKLLREYNDYQKSGDNVYKFNKIYFASATEYMDNALKYANANNVDCYLRIKKNKFKKAEYWVK